MFDPILAQTHLNKLLKQYNITVLKWSVGSTGRAYISEHKIKIPKPSDIDRFCVCMHEIKHIIDGSRGKLFEKEYACEMYAIQQAELLGFDCTEYKERARRYVIMCIAKGYCRKLNLNNIPDKIKEFCNVDFTKWVGKNVFIENWGTATYKNLPLLIKIE